MCHQQSFENHFGLFVRQYLVRFLIYCKHVNPAPSRRSMGKAHLVVLALLATACCCSGDIWPIKERRRTAKCFANARDEFRTLGYGGGNKSVSIAYPSWASGR